MPMHVPTSCCPRKWQKYDSLFLSFTAKYSTAPPTTPMRQESRTISGTCMSRPLSSASRCTWPSPLAPHSACTNFEIEHGQAAHVRLSLPRSARLQLAAVEILNFAIGFFKLHFSIIHTSLQTAVYWVPMAASRRCSCRSNWLYGFPLSQGNQCVRCREFGDFTSSSTFVKTVCLESRIAVVVLLVNLVAATNSLCTSQVARSSKMKRKHA